MIRFLIDENVPKSVAEFLQQRGHDVQYVVDVLPRGTADPIVTLVGDQLAAVIVTWNRKDFERLVTRVPAGGRQRFRRASRLVFACNETHGRRLIEENMWWVEMEYEMAQRRDDQRVMLEIGENYHKSYH